MNISSLNNDSGFEAEKAVISTKRTEDSSVYTTDSNTANGAYLDFCITGIQLGRKDRQHGLAHLSHPRDQLGLDCIRTLKREEKSQKSV